MELMTRASSLLLIIPSIRSSVTPWWTSTAKTDGRNWTRCYQRVTNDDRPFVGTCAIEIEEADVWEDDRVSCRPPIGLEKSQRIGR